MLSGSTSRAAVPISLAAGLLLAGCASRGTAPGSNRSAGAAPVGAGPTTAGNRGSWLFRAELDGAHGGGSVRLTLRRFDAATFDLAAADVLGQSRWRLLSANDEAIWIDRTRQRYCRLSASRGLPGGELRSALRIADLPALLLRELPGEPPETAPPASGRAELEDALGRRFSGEREGGAWKSWTMRLGDRPLLWFRVDAAQYGKAAGATLSGRDPAFVLRWRETARGELGADEKLELATPEGFAEESCVDAPPA